MRRGVGIQAVQKHTLQQKQLQTIGEKINQDSVKKIKDQLVVFKENLEQFAIKHKKDIQKNPEFRKHFNDMCLMIGVDPLASGKGFWSQVLGVGDFYYELGVQIIEVCLKYRSSNGGLIEMNLLLEYIKKMRGKNSIEISCDDIESAIGKLKVLGNGFNILQIDSKKIVQSVPCELNKDHTDVLVVAQQKGYTTVSIIQSELKWNLERTNSVLNFLLQEGIAWIDDQSTEVMYWFPSLWGNSFEN